MAKAPAERSFIEELPSLLEERGMSMREVARRADVSQGYLSRILRGVGNRTRPTARLAREVAKALDLEDDYFIEAREGRILDAIRADEELREEVYKQVLRAWKRTNKVP